MVALSANLAQEVRDRLLLGSPLDQRQVASQCRQAVAQLVRESGCQLAELRQTRRQLFLISKPLRFCQVDEQNQMAAYRPVVPTQGVDSQAEQSAALRGLDDDLLSRQSGRLVDRLGQGIAE